MNLERFLTGCSEAELTALYQSHWTVQAVLRSLPSLSKQYILRLLFVDQPVPKKNVDVWIKPDFERKHQEALDHLQKLGIFQESNTKSGEESWTINPGFQSKLREAVCGWGAVVEVLPPAVLDAVPPAEELDGYANRQWEALLLYLLRSSTQQPSLPSYLRHMRALDVGKLMKEAELMGDRREGQVTEKGFQFLLQSPSLQLWTLLDLYIRDAQSKSGMEVAAILSFLLQLSFRKVGQPCELQQLLPQEQAIAAHCIQLGMLYPFQVNKAVYFCPTSLASSLCEGQGTGVASAEVGGGHIVVETNYRVYAYTSSPVQVSVLELFCQKDCRLPNLFVGTLTRDSVLRAVECGISGDQMVEYLRQHAHPQVARRVTVLPEVVSDQIRLWEADTKRVQAVSAILYGDFASEPLFQKAVNFARNIGAYLWHDAKTQRMVARAESKQRIKDYIIKARDGPVTPKK